MSVYIIDQQGKRQGLPGKKSKVYTVHNRGGQRPLNYPAAMCVYNSGAQSIPPGGGWTNVTFNTAPFPSTAYGMPIMWTAGNLVYFMENGWYLITASTCFDPVGVDTYQGFRLLTTVAGTQLLGCRSYVGLNYTLPQSSEIIYYMIRGDSIRLDVTHNYGGWMTLAGGQRNCAISVARISP
jgi:hypothetical protein